MANRGKPVKRSTLLAELHIPLLILGAFCLGAGGMWLIMRSSAPDKPATVERFAPSPAPASGPPDVSTLSPADAAKTLADWNYDRQNWPHAISLSVEASFIICSTIAGFRMVTAESHSAICPQGFSPLWRLRMMERSCSLAPANWRGCVKAS